MWINMQGWQELGILWEVSHAHRYYQGYFHNNFINNVLYKISCLKKFDLV
jgi:hypothetical protein